MYTVRMSPARTAKSNWRKRVIGQERDSAAHADVSSRLGARHDHRNILEPFRASALDTQLSISSPGRHALVIASGAATRRPDDDYLLLFTAPKVRLHFRKGYHSRISPSGSLIGPRKRTPRGLRCVRIALYEIQRGVFDPDLNHLA